MCVKWYLDVKTNAFVSLVISDTERFSNYNEKLLSGLFCIMWPYREMWNHRFCSEYTYWTEESTDFNQNYNTSLLHSAHRFAYEVSKYRQPHFCVGCMNKLTWSNHFSVVCLFIHLSSLSKCHTLVLQPSKVFTYLIEHV